MYKLPSNFLSIAVTIITILPLCYPASMKSLNSSCLCDISTNCDFQCCCDAQCPTTLTSMLGTYNKCEDDGFGIPFCAGVNITDVHQDDLYSGLRTIYTVIKRLFCIYRVNIYDPTTNYNKSALSATATAQAKISANINSATLKPDKYASLSSLSIPGIFFRSELGLCTVTNSILSYISTDGLQQCRALLVSSTISANDILSIGKIVSNFPNINIFNMTSSSGDGSPVTLGSTNTFCGSTSCYNVVKLLKLYINPASNQVNQGLSYVVIGSLDKFVDNSYVITRYQYQYLNEDGSFANVSNIGYDIGSPLQLLKSNGSNFKIANPINLAFRDASGNCRISSTQSSDQSLIQLKLGRNQFHTCVGEQSLIYSNLRNSFNMIGVMGSSNYALSDYITVDWPSNTATTDSNNVVLKIQYTKVGAATNPQYYVLKATAELKTNNNLKEKSLFIEYQLVTASAEMYIPLPPVVDAYLPNDFLYPFYVAQ